MNARFIGEETYSKGASRDYLINNEPTWCIDPLDGMSPAWKNVLKVSTRQPDLEPYWAAADPK